MRPSDSVSPLLLVLAACMSAVAAPAKPPEPFIAGSGRFAEILCLAVDAKGRLYILDAGGDVGAKGKTVKPRVVVFVPGGRQILELTLYDAKEAGSRKPLSLAVSPDGDLYVSDTAGAGAGPAEAAAEPSLEIEELDAAGGPGDEGETARDILSPGRILVFTRLGTVKYERKRVLENLGDAPHVRTLRVGDTDELFVLLREKGEETEAGKEPGAGRNFVKVLRPDGEETAEFAAQPFGAWTVARDRTIYGIEGKLWRLHVRGTPTGKIEERHRAGGLVSRYSPGKWRREEVVGTIGKMPAQPDDPASLAVDSRGHLFVMDGKCEEFDRDGVFVQDYTRPLIPGDGYSPGGLLFDAEDNAYFFDRETQNIYRLSPEQRQACRSTREQYEGFCLGAEARIEPNQFLEGDGQPELVITLRRFFARFPGLYLRYHFEDGLGARLTEVKAVDVLSAIKSSKETLVEIRVPVTERRFGIVAANLEFGWEKGLLARQSVGTSIIPKYPEFKDGETGFIGAAHRMGLKCERGYPWPVWSAIQSRTGGDFVVPEAQMQLARHADRLGLRLFFQLGPNGPPGEPAGFYRNEDYEDYACQMTEWFTTLKHWELVNEPPAHGAPEWYVETYLKPAYRGIKRANPEVQVLGMTTCGWHWGALERVLKSGGALYMDAEAVHIFTPGYSAPEESGLETVVAADRRAMRRYGLGEIPIWLTETQWRLRHTKMAQDVVHCYLHAESLGIFRDQIYYFMAHTTGFGPDWGLFGPLFSPLSGSGMRSMGLGLRVLGHLANDKQLTRTEAWLPWLRVQLYENEAQRVYVVYSYDFPTDIQLGTDADTVRCVDFYGNERVVEPKEKRFTASVSGYPCYLVTPRDKRVWLWDTRQVGPNVALATMGTTATASEEKHQVFGAEHPPEGAIDGCIHREWDNLLGWVNAEPDKSPDWLELEFPFERTIRRVNLYCHSQNSGCPAIGDYELLYEQDGKWKSIVRNRECKFRTAFTHELPDVRARKLKVVVHEIDTWAGKWTQLYEVQAYAPWGSDVGMDILPEWTHYDAFVAGQECRITVRLKSYRPEPSSGTVRLTLPDAGEIIGDAEKAFEVGADSSVDLTFAIRPEPQAEGPYRVEARLSAKDGKFPSLVGRRTVAVKSKAAEEWMPKITVADPSPDPGDGLSRANAENLWTRSSLSKLAVTGENRLRLAWREAPQDLARAGPKSTPAALWDGDPATAWKVASRFCDRYTDAVVRARRQEQTAAGAGLELGTDRGKGAEADLSVGDERIDAMAGQESRTIEWSLAETLAVDHVRTHFADGLKGQYELFLSASASQGGQDWTRIAAGRIDAPIITTELAEPLRAQRSKIVLSDLAVPADARGAEWRPVIDQIVAASQIAVCDLSGEQTVGQVETQFADSIACEYELYATADTEPSGNLRAPAWRRICALRRAAGSDTVTIEPAVKARQLATRVILAEPVGELFKGGDFEFTGVDGFGRPLHPIGVPVGLDGARFERKDVFSGRQSLRIPPGGKLVHKPMPYRTVFAGGIAIGPDDRAERYLLAFYAKGGRTVWTIRLLYRKQMQKETIGEHKIEVPASRDWRRHTFLIDPIDGKMNLMEIEATVAKGEAGDGRDADALLDDVILVPGFSAPLSGALASDQKVLSPSEHHAEGSMVSAPFEIGTRPKPIVLRWDGEVPERTGISVQVRFGRALGKGEMQWGEWSELLPGGKATTLAEGGGSLAQVSAKLSSSAPRRSPSLHSLHLTYAGSSVPLGTLYRGGPTPKIMELRKNLTKYSHLRRESAWAQFEIGRLYGVLGHVEQAVGEYGRVVEEYKDIAPWAAAAMCETGELLRNAGQLDRARETFQQCIEKFGKLDNCLYPVRKSKAAIEWIEQKRK